MNLKDDFYRILVDEQCSIQELIPAHSFLVKLNPAHFIYKAHFPDNPITPGVCIIQIAKELMESLLNCSLFIREIKNVKFLNVINPDKSGVIAFNIKYSLKDKNAIKVEANVVDIVDTEDETIKNVKETTFAKLSMLLIKQ